MGTPTILLQTAVDRVVLQTTPYPLLHHTQAWRPASLAQTWSASVIRDALWHVRQSYVTEWESTDVWNICVTLNWQQRARQGVLRFTSLPAWFSPILQTLFLQQCLWVWSPRYEQFCTAGVEVFSQLSWKHSLSGSCFQGEKQVIVSHSPPTACTSPQRYKALFKKQSVLQKIYSFRDTTKWNSRQM